MSQCEIFKAKFFHSVFVQSSTILQANNLPLIAFASRKKNILPGTWCNLLKKILKRKLRVNFFSSSFLSPFLIKKRNFFPRKICQITSWLIILIEWLPIKVTLEQLMTWYLGFESHSVENLIAKCNSSSHKFDIELENSHFIYKKKHVAVEPNRKKGRWMTSRGTESETKIPTT